jgi:hypothetical protein
LSISLKGEICEQLETRQNSFKSYFYLYCIKVEPWIRNPFLSDINCIEDVNLAKINSLISGQKIHYNWSLTQKALENSGAL